MHFCRVTRVFLPAIAGVLLRQIHHDAVTCHFGHNGRGRHRQTARIPFDQRGRRATERFRDHVAVDQRVTRRCFQPSHGTLHRQM